MRVSTIKLLEAARNGGYAVPAFNTINLEVTRGIVAAAEELNVPIMLAMAYDAIEHMGMEALYRGAEVVAREARVPVAMHLDHGRSYDEVAQAVRLGFDSVMIDFSFLPFEENVEQTREAAHMAHSFNVPIEAELGHVPGGENTPTEEDASHMVYTDPEIAGFFTRQTEIDFLAVSVGTVHGVYKAAPELRIDLVAEINKRVKKPLVLHGGSGTPANQVKAAIANGICKVNVGTHIMHSFVEGMLGVDRGCRDIRTFMLAGRARIADAVRQAVDTFGTSKANL